MRDALDRYYTPDEVAGKLVRELPISGRVLEPHVGGGAFLRAMPSGVEVTAGDIDPLAPGLTNASRCYVGDFEAHRGSYDWVIGNPPYRHAEAHVRHALTLAPDVAFLLRLAFLESRRRRPFWDEHPPYHVWILSRRPSFTGGATDNSAYAWFWWSTRAPGSLPTMSWL